MVDAAGAVGQQAVEAARPQVEQPLENSVCVRINGDSGKFGNMLCAMGTSSFRARQHTHRRPSVLRVIGVALGIANHGEGDLV